MYLLMFYIYIYIERERREIDGWSEGDWCPHTLPRGGEGVREGERERERDKGFSSFFRFSRFFKFCQISTCFVFPVCPVSPF